MDPRRMEPHLEHEELHDKRKELHGKRRRLHEQLSDVCEEFVLSDMTKEHKQKALVRELQYLLDYYREEASWEGPNRHLRHQGYYMCEIQTILQPTDFSEHSEWVFHLGCSLARVNGARLIVLHVIPPPVCHGDVVAQRQPDGYREQMCDW
jgi:hypothetical protein